MRVALTNPTWRPEVRRSRPDAWRLLMHRELLA